MFTLKHLRIAIILLWVAITGLFMSQAYYDPTLPSAYDQAQQLLGDEPSLVGLTVSLLILATLVYFSAALWNAHRSGKLVFLFYIALILLSNTHPIVFSGSDYFFIELSDVISGAILILIFTPTIKEELRRKKSLATRKALTPFIVFTALGILEYLIAANVF